MSKAQRITGQDTVDSAIHMLHKLQAEGWGLENLSQDLEYGEIGKHKLPIRATIVIRLTPLSS